MKQLDANSCDNQAQETQQQQPQARVSDGNLKPSRGTSHFRRLVEACKRKDLASVKSILAQKPELGNQRDKQERNLLHYSVILLLGDDKSTDSAKDDQSGGKQQVTTRDEALKSIDCFDYLIDRCDLKLWWQQDADGLTILHMAVISSNLPMVEHIVYEHPYAVKYPLVCTPDRERHTPLHWAVITNSLECVKLLVNYAGIKLAHEPDLNGATPLHYATQTSDYPRYRQQLRCMLRSVGSSFSSASYSSSTNSTGEQTDAMTFDKVISSNGSGDIKKGQQQQTQQRTLDILEYLVGLPQIDLEIEDRDRRTPLLWAASSGNRLAIELLLAHGANAMKCDANQLGALHCAASHGFTDCLESLLAPRRQQVAPVNANQADNLSCTPLFYSVLSGNIDCVEALLERGAESDWQDSKGRTAAHFAALKGQLGALKLLLERRANLWLPNKQGDLPLHYAIKSGRIQVVRWLLEHSPYERAVNAINNFGRAPIHLAVHRNNLPLVEYLIGCGANLNQLVKTRGHRSRGSASADKGSVQYETAVDMAKSLGHAECLQVLVENKALPAEQVLSNRGLTAASQQSISTQPANSSLFDIRAAQADGPSPIGFETSCSSASPQAPTQRPLDSSGLELAKSSVSQVPKLRRPPVLESIPCTDSTGSSAMSQNSLTSPRGGRADFAGNKQSAADGDRNFSQETGRRRESQKSAPKPHYRGGISYNNEHICASIKCKLYKDQPAEGDCSRRPQQTQPAASPGDHLSRTDWRSGGPEIITNVNVYTSPCAHCMHRGLRGPSLGRDECRDCGPGSRKEAELPDVINLATEDEEEEEEGEEDGGDERNEDSGSDEEDEELVEGPEVGSSRPSAGELPSVEQTRAGHTRIGRHCLPPSQGHEQRLPVILSEREQSTSATSNEEEEEERESPGGEINGEQYYPVGQTVSGSRGPPRRTLVSPSAEEPRFDRAAPRAPNGRPADRRYQVRSPVADYIHGGGSQTPSRPISLQRSPVQNRRRANAQGGNRKLTATTRRNDDQSLDPECRSKSMSVLPSPLAARGRASSRQAAAASPARSVSRQTIIRTRRLSVDGQELATRVEKSIWKYKQETKLFEELQNLKRSQIRSGRANEAVLVKRHIDHLRLDTKDLIGLDSYQGPYTYKSYELFLYDQLRKLSQSNCAKLSSLRPVDLEDNSDFRQQQQASPNYLDEDLKAEMELRRIIGDDEELSAGSQLHQAAADEIVLLEPSGALEEIRVRGDGHEQLNEDHDKVNQEESGRERELVHENLEPERNRNDLEQETNEQKIEEQLVRKDSATSIESVKLEDGGRKSRELDEEAQSLSSAIIVDALGNVSRAGSARQSPDLAEEMDSGDMDAKQEVDAEAETSELEAQAAAKQPLETEDERETVEMQRASPGRRRSVVNIGNKMDVVYHDVGIEIEPAPEREPESGDDDRVELKPTSSEVEPQDLESNEEKKDEPGETVEPQTKQNDATDLHQRLANVAEVSESIEALDGDEQVNEILPEKIEATSKDLIEEDTSSKMEREGSISGRESISDEVPQKQSASSSRRSSASDRRKLMAGSGGSTVKLRRASSPVSSATSTTSDASKSGEGDAGSRLTSRRSRYKSTGGSSGSTCGGDTSPRASKVFNGHDLDEMHSRRLSQPSRKRAESEGQIEERPGGQANSTTQVRATFSDKGCGSDSISEIVKPAQPPGERQSTSGLDASRSQEVGAFAPDEMSGSSPSRSRNRKSASPRRRLERSHLPSVEYKPEVDLDRIRERWSPIKAQGLRMRRELDAGLRQSAGKGEALGLGISTAKSQPNLRLDQGGGSNELDYDGSNPHKEFTLIYEFNKRHASGESDGDRDRCERWIKSDKQKEEENEDSRGQNARLSVQSKRKKGGNWCNRMAAQIVDVRTVKRTLSLPEALIYSNDLLKRFNILKL